MSLLLAAQVWHHWISYALLAPAILIVVGVIVGYLVKVQSLKYPRNAKK